MNKPQSKLQKNLTGQSQSHSASSTGSPCTISEKNSDSGSSPLTMHSAKRKRSTYQLDDIPHKQTTQKNMPAFLNKLYNMVDDDSTNNLVRWSRDGNSFLVERHEEFAKTVLPRFYKHNTFASFVRQLNMYDFHKIPHIQNGVMLSENDHEIWEFNNPYFQRHRPDLLIHVVRKKNKDREIEEEDPTITLVEDMYLVKKHQANVNAQLMNLHRDNEILWQETLNSREKSRRHQEAIRKILLFLTTVFSTDPHSSGLLKEVASLADMKLDQDADKFQSSISGLDNSNHILSSVLKLSSVNETPTQSTSKASHKAEDGKALSEFSHTLNTATSSANIINQDIDLLQTNIESLASYMGIDPSQLDSNMDYLSTMWGQQNTMENKVDQNLIQSPIDFSQQRSSSGMKPQRKTPLSYDNPLNAIIYRPFISTNRNDSFESQESIPNLFHLPKNEENYNLTSSKNGYNPQPPFHNKR